LEAGESVTAETANGNKALAVASETKALEPVKEVLVDGAPGTRTVATYGGMKVIKNNSQFTTSQLDLAISREHSLLDQAIQREAAYYHGPTYAQPTKWGALFDMAVAFCVYMGSTVYFVLNSDAPQSFAELPEDEDESAIATEMCPIILKQMDEMRDIKFNREHLNDARTKYLKAFVDFERNCNKHEHFQFLKRERNFQF
jgi:hypothetical protein